MPVKTREELEAEQTAVEELIAKLLKDKEELEKSLAKQNNLWGLIKNPDDEDIYAGLWVVQQNRETGEFHAVLAAPSTQSLKCAFISQADAEAYAEAMQLMLDARLVGEHIEGRIGGQQRTIHSSAGYVPHFGTTNSDLSKCVFGTWSGNNNGQELLQQLGAERITRVFKTLGGV